MTVWSLRTVFVALNVPRILPTVPTRYARNGFIMGDSMRVFQLACAEIESTDILGEEAEESYDRSFSWGH